MHVDEIILKIRRIFLEIICLTEPKQFKSLLSRTNFENSVYENDTRRKMIDFPLTMHPNEH